MQPPNAAAAPYVPQGMGGDQQYGDGQPGQHPSQYMQMPYQGGDVSQQMMMMNSGFMDPSQQQQQQQPQPQHQNQMMYGYGPQGQMMMMPGMMNQSMQGMHPSMQQQPPPQQQQPQQPQQPQQQHMNTQMLPQSQNMQFVMMPNQQSQMAQQGSAQMPQMPQPSQMGPGYGGWSGSSPAGMPINTMNGSCGMPGMGPPSHDGSNMVMMPNMPPAAQMDPGKGGMSGGGELSDGKGGRVAALNRSTQPKQGARQMPGGRVTGRPMDFQPGSPPQNPPMDIGINAICAVPQGQPSSANAANALVSASAQAEAKSRGPAKPWADVCDNPSGFGLDSELQDMWKMGTRPMPGSPSGQQASSQGNRQQKGGRGKDQGAQARWAPVQPQATSDSVKGGKGGGSGWAVKESPPKAAAPPQQFSQPPAASGGGKGNRKKLSRGDAQISDWLSQRMGASGGDDDGGFGGDDYHDYNDGGSGSNRRKGGKKGGKDSGRDKGGKGRGSKGGKWSGSAWRASN